MHGERTRPGCSFPRLAENTGRNENIQAFLDVVFPQAQQRPGTRARSAIIRTRGQV